ncbi:MAG: hypothetical protein ACKO2L_12670 [Planctomycetaceae bacterium]
MDKCKSAMHHATPNRNEIPPNTAAKHPNRAATVREWNHYRIASPEVARYMAPARHLHGRARRGDVMGLMGRMGPMNEGGGQ